MLRQEEEIGRLKYGSSLQGGDSQVEANIYIQVALCKTWCSPHLHRISMLLHGPAGGERNNDGSAPV